MGKSSDISIPDALSCLESYMNSLDPKRQRLLAYWIKDYVRFLEKESSFDPQKLIRYKRGSIVKANLGYRIGSEEGGLHYAVVIDNANAQKAQTVTVIPLTSVKPGTDITALHSSRVYLGDEIYQSLNKKLDDAIKDIDAIHRSLLAQLSTLQEDIDLSAPNAKTLLAERKVAIDLVEKQIEVWKEKSYHAQKMSDEIGKMKRGSIALISQITTISKIRIYDPLYPADTLNKIRLSNLALTSLDEQIKKMFTKSN